MDSPYKVTKKLYEYHDYYKHRIDDLEYTDDICNLYRNYENCNIVILVNLFLYFI